MAMDMLLNMFFLNFILSRYLFIFGLLDQLLVVFNISLQPLVGLLNTEDISIVDQHVLGQRADLSLRSLELRLEIVHDQMLVNVLGYFSVERQAVIHRIVLLFSVTFW